MEKEPELVKNYYSSNQPDDTEEENQLNSSFSNNENNMSDKKIGKIRKNESLVNLQPSNKESQKGKKMEFSSERKIINSERKSKNDYYSKNQVAEGKISLDNGEDKPYFTPNKKEKDNMLNINVRSLIRNEKDDKLKTEGNDDSPFHKNLRIEPLCNFDEQVLKDFDPQELLLKGEQRAFSKWIDHDGKTVWKECIILGFNQERNKFIIRWINSEMTKEVNRLNLILPNENQEDFQIRTDIAIEKREKKLLLLQTLGSI